MTKTTENPQEQALNTALDELDQWFGLAGVTMDSPADALAHHPAHQLIEYPGAEHPGTDYPIDSASRPRHDTSITDTNELLLDSIDEELDLWDDTTESEQSESETSGDPAESDKDAEATDSDREDTHASTVQNAVIDSAAAVETADFAEVLSWATINQTGAVQPNGASPMQKAPSPHASVKEDAPGIVDPFEALMEEALLDGSLDEEADQPSMTDDTAVTEALTEREETLDAEILNEETLNEEALNEETLAQATLTFIPNNPLEDLLEGEAVGNAADAPEPDTPEPMTGDALLEEALARETLARETLAQANTPEQSEESEADANTMASAAVGFEAIFAGAIAQATAQALAHSETVQIQSPPEPIPTEEDASEAIAVIAPEPDAEPSTEPDAETAPETAPETLPETEAASPGLTQTEPEDAAPIEAVTEAVTEEIATEEETPEAVVTEGAAEAETLPKEEEAAVDGATEAETDESGTSEEVEDSTDQGSMDETLVESEEAEMEAIAAPEAESDAATDSNLEAESDAETEPAAETESLPETDDEPEAVPIAVIPPPNPAELIGYDGPEEVLIKTAIVLKGSYDTSLVTTVQVSAEDKYAFEVLLDPSVGLWSVQLSKGFYQAGARWIRLQALDDQGRVIASRVINLIVSANPLSVGQALKLTVQRDTFFKETPTDSRSLKKLAITRVPVGTQFVVKRYSYTNGYVLVELDAPLGNVGTTGYFYASHIELRKGQQLLAFDIGQVPVIVPGSGQVLITHDTLLKKKPVDSSDLSEAQTYAFNQGEHFEITGYACIRGHFRVTLHTEIEGFGKTGYLYFDHAQLQRDDQAIEFDPDALLASVLETTTLKKRPVNLSDLEDSEKVSLSKGQVYGVLHYEPAESGHLAITFSDHIPGFGNSGYLSPSHIQLNRGPQVIPTLASQMELNVPYFGQRDNDFRPRATCNVTAMAMVMHYYGVRAQWGQLEDELYQWCINNHGEDSHIENVVLVKMARAYGFEANFATDRTWTDIHNRLRQKQPVVVGGYFTADGHILTVIGFNSKGYIVNDPWGDAMTGYRSGYGRKLFYPKAYMDRMCSPEGEGNIWAHFIEPKT